MSSAIELEKSDQTSSCSSGLRWFRVGPADRQSDNSTGGVIPPRGTFAIRNARIVTVSGPDIENGTVVIRDGKIEAVGANVAVPAGAQTIDGRGLSVYPGMIDAGTNMGLVGSSAGRTALSILPKLAT